MISTLSEQPLAAILAAIETRLNTRLAESVTAKAMLSELTGKSVALKIKGLNLRIICAATPRELQLFSDANRAAQAELSGTPLNLLRLLTAEPQAVIRQGYVQLNGDTDTAEQLQTLLEFIKPELEEELAGIMGDSAARQVSLVAQDVQSWLTGVRRSVERSTGEYLREERRHLPTAPEMAEFVAEVDELALAVDRAAARLQEYALQIKGPAQ
jgi:ubiquinone biosynthesis protein UbiJ